MLTSGLATSELEQLSLFLTQQYGLEFRQQRLTLLRDAVQARLQACELTTAGSYLQLVRNHETELLQLLNLITIHETYFFREPAQLASLRKLLLASRQPVLRLLSAGCSTGEEAYSLAITALTCLPGAGRDFDVEVIGIDVDQAAISQARAGSYGEYSFRACPPALQQRYFTLQPDGHRQISPQIKAKVRFETLNLFTPDYPPWLQQLDIIFYRNVSIYFSPDQRRRIFRRLTELLNPDGCLFLSCTETLNHHSKQLTLVKDGETFYYQKKAAGQQTGCIPLPKPPLPARPRQAPIPLAGKARPNLRPQRPKTPPAAATADCHQAYSTAVKLAEHKQYADAIACLDEIIAANSFFIKAYTCKANILLNQQQPAAAVALCETALVMDTFCLEAYLLLGLAARLTNQPAAASQHFKAAVYTAPECWLAHFLLAQLHQQQADRQSACREYALAMKLLQQGRFDQHGLSLFTLPFQPDDIIQLCRHNLTTLQS